MKSLNLPYNPRIDQLRWLAATLVFLFHYYLAYREQGGLPLASNWFGLVTEGHTGVGLFFVLSGYLFMQIAQHQQQIHYRDFLRNRCLRILPLFLTIFMLATAIGRDKFAPQDVLYVLSTNLGLAPTSYTPVTGAAWSISLEFTFYLVFPFLARFTLEQGARYLLKLLALMVFFKLAAYNVNEKSTLMYFSTLVGRFDQFLIGMLAAVLAARHGARLHGRLALPALAMSVLLVVFNSALQSKFAKFDPATHTRFWIWWSMLEAAGWSCLIATWLAAAPRLPAWLENALDQGGKISFSFYLLHMGVIHLLAKSFGLPAITGDKLADALLLLPFVYGAAWAVSALSYSAVEEPFLRLRRTYGAASPDVQLASGAA